MAEPYVVVEVSEDEAAMLDRLVEALGWITKKNNPLDKLALKIADASGPRHSSWGRCRACNGLGWDTEEGGG